MSSSHRRRPKGHRINQWKWPWKLQREAGWWSDQRKRTRGCRSSTMINITYRSWCQTTQLGPRLTSTKIHISHMMQGRSRSLFQKNVLSHGRESRPKTLAKRLNPGWILTHKPAWMPSIYNHGTKSTKSSCSSSWNCKPKTLNLTTASRKISITSSKWNKGWSKRRWFFNREAKKIDFREEWRIRIWKRVLKSAGKSQGIWKIMKCILSRIFGPVTPITMSIILPKITGRPSTIRKKRYAVRNILMLNWARRASRKLISTIWTAGRPKAR